MSVRVNCRLLTAERVITFAKELNSQLSEETRTEIIAAFREILLNAMEHGAAFNPDQVVEITVVRRHAAWWFMFAILAQVFGGSRLTMLLSRILKTRPRTSPYAKPKACVRAASAS